MIFATIVSPGINLSQLMCDNHDHHDYHEHETDDYNDCKPSFWLKCKSFCKKLSFIAALGAIGWDSACLALGKHNNKTWWQTTKASYKGLASLASLPVLWGICHYWKNKNNQLEEVEEKEDISRTSFTIITKPAGSVSFVKSCFDDRDFFVRNYNENATLGKRIIIQYDGLRQGPTADCGYYAIHNAICLSKNDFNALTNEKQFKKEYAIWKKSVENGRNSAKKRQSGYSNIDSGEIEEIIIKNHVSQLRNKLTQNGIKTVYIKNNISIIDYLDGIQTMIEQNAIGGIDRHTLHNINRFRTKKSPQIIILNSSSGNVYLHHSLSWHWFVVKLEHLDNDTNDIQMTVVDSLRGDIKNHPILDQLFHLFVNVKLPQEYNS